VNGCQRSTVAYSPQGDVRFLRDGPRLVWMRGKILSTTALIRSSDVAQVFGGAETTSSGSGDERQIYILLVRSVLSRT
jgi:hypothetical protein